MKLFALRQRRAKMAGEPGPSDPFPQTLLADHVRFYQR
jgi:hypothetical protein